MRAEGRNCPADQAHACETASRFSRVVLWVSAAVYAAGFFTAFLLGPILSRLDR
jgi:putative copper export protein